MKRVFRLFPILAILLALNMLNAQAQIREFGNYLILGEDDAELLLSSHLSPFMSGFGASMTGGWYTTAKAHKPGGFDISIITTTSLVPSDYRTYTLDNTELNHVSFAEGGTSENPTLAGSNEDGAQLMYNYGEFTDSAFAMPPGSGIAFVPVPIIQAGIGLVKGTELVGRYMPHIGAEGKGKYGFWGVGVRHDIKQWIPFLKATPIIHMSVVAGYTRMNAYVDLHATPGPLNILPYALDIDDVLWDEQRIIANTNSFTANLVASVNLPVITIYGAAGLAHTKSKLSFEGNYPIITGTEDGTEGAIPLVEAQELPYEFVLENQDGGHLKPRLNLGLRFKMLKVMFLNVDYTRANYNALTVGLGFTFR